MGFIDYVIDYFRGPAGADGATGPVGPAGPETLHKTSDLTLIEDFPIEDGVYSVTFTLPDGAVFVAAPLTYTNPFSATSGVTSWVITQPVVNQVKVEATVVGAETTIINVAVLYYLP